MASVVVAGRATSTATPAWRRWLTERGPRLATAAAATWMVGWLLAMWFAPEGFIKGRFEDGGVYYLAGRAFLHGQDYYASPDFRQWPLVAAIWAPVALVPPAFALRLWMLFTIAAVGGGVALLARSSWLPARPNARWLLFTIGGPATLFMLYLDQMSGACFAAYAVGLALLRRRPALAGGCFALMAFKPHLALLALPALTIAGWPALLAFAGAMALWPLGSLLVAGPAVFRTFLVQVYAVRDSNIGLVASSLSSLVPLRGTAHATLQFGLLAVMLLGIAWLAWRRWRAGRLLTPAAVDLAVTLCLSAMPYALVSDLLFTLPLLIRLGVTRERRPWLVITAWWGVPWVATLLTHQGFGGLAALLPLIIAGFTVTRMGRDGRLMGVEAGAGRDFKRRPAPTLPSPADTPPDTGSRRG